jgi:hypothetical protein
MPKDRSQFAALPVRLLPNLPRRGTSAPRELSVPVTGTLNLSPFDIRLTLVRTRRGWLALCPRCNRRAAVLFFSCDPDQHPLIPTTPAPSPASIQPACRVCVGLAYRSQTLSKPPAPSPSLPDFPRLVETLSALGTIPDGLGETQLSYDEAAKIRACGVHARAGSVWRCPPLPDELVRSNSLLHHLSDAVDPLWRSEGWKTKRAPVRHKSQTNPLRRTEAKFLTTLEKAPGQRLRKRQLQQKLWRLGARFFNFTLNRLIAEDRIMEHGGYLHPWGRHQFESVQQEARERRLRPISVFYD